MVGIRLTVCFWAASAICIVIIYFCDMVEDVMFDLIFSFPLSFFATEMIVVTESMSWKLVAKQYNSNEAAIGVVIFQKPKDNQELYETSCRVATSSLPFCSEVDNADAAW
jgi:hypothetical protein